ncbi:galactosyltransferase-related protein [Streptomyces sp. NPDC047123]|uniref:galactosyltransferase-related protein n=1 Tax=Streptomyces sp. NPDC047123 TaxID=3155622 RepID=UPI0033C90BE9
MSTPPEPSVPHLAERLTAYAVLAHDPAVPGIAADYWAKSEAHYRKVDAALTSCVADTPATARPYADVLADPSRAAAQHALREALAARLAERPDSAAQLAQAVAEADRHIWIDYHLGADYTAQAPEATSPEAPEPSAPTAAAVARPRHDGPGAVRIVIPFRDRAGGLRTRNLLACLRALADQEGGPAHRITVVETDSEPRSRAILADLVDDYVFARKDGLFNKAWAVNVGVVATAADTPYTCVLDADILVDRHFVARNAERLREGDHGAHLTFRWSLSLDEPSTLRAIALRNDDAAADVPESVLRGLLLREPPGGCVWVRTEVFHAVGGFDERYEGWGGEDDDVVARLGAAATLLRYTDPLLHLNHPRPEMTRDDGVPFNAHIEPLSWAPAHGYGDREKFIAATA